MARKILSILILLMLAASYAHAIGVGGEGLRFGRVGSTAGKPGSPPVGCTPTGLKFNVACNSQYTTVIHF